MVHIYITKIEISDFIIYGTYSYLQTEKKTISILVNYLSWCLLLKNTRKQWSQKNQWSFRCLVVRQIHISTCNVLNCSKPLHNSWLLILESLINLKININVLNLNLSDTSNQFNIFNIFRRRVSWKFQNNSHTAVL